MSVATIPAGWYPDPADPERRRWWSGESWTDHVEAPARASREPDHDDAPDLQRFTRDPALRNPASRALQDALPNRRDPYRERPVFALIALGVALLSIPGTVADAIWHLPPLIGYVFGGVPVTLAFLALLVSWRLGVGVRMAILAIVISVVTMGAGFALDAEQGIGDVGNIVVPGLQELQELQQSETP